VCWPLGSLEFLSSLLKSKSLVEQLLVGLEPEGQQLIAELRRKTLAEQLLLVSIIGHVPWGVTREMVEFTTISAEVHTSLLQIQELPPLQIHDRLRNVLRTEGSAEISPSEDMVGWKQCHMAFPPTTSCTNQEVGGKVDLFSHWDKQRGELALKGTKPVISF
jgi:hypothetical protein